MRRDAEHGDRDTHAPAAHTQNMTEANGAGRLPMVRPGSGPIRRWVRENPGDVVDVFVYVVVLNLAVEYVPSVISEGFTLSLLTAILLKVALEGVIAVKNRILIRLRSATTRRAKTAAAVCLWVVAVGSKLVVL